MTTVLNAKLAFDMTLHQVAKRTADNDNGSKTHPLEEAKRSGLYTPDSHTGHEGEETTAYAAYPCLLGRYTGEQLPREDAMQSES